MVYVMINLNEKLRLWIDDVRKAPYGYVWLKSVNSAIDFIEKNVNDIELIDIDHDAGDYYSDGGDYIKILDYLEFMRLSYPIHIHSMNPVGVQNMRNIINKNGWIEY